MQSSLVDRKLSILYDKYKDREFVRTAQKEVEGIRRTANYTGAAVTAGALFLNEAVRLTKRSRKYIKTMPKILLFSKNTKILISYQ